MFCKYDDMRKKVFAHGRIPDGWEGATRPVEFAFDDATGTTICVHEMGFFRYHTPPAVDVEEARWLLEKHPSSNVKEIKSGGISWGVFAPHGRENHAKTE